jgi:hypothetical protein
MKIQCTEKQDSNIIYIFIYLLLLMLLILTIAVADMAVQTTVQRAHDNGAYETHQQLVDQQSSRYTLAGW